MPRNAIRAALLLLLTVSLTGCWSPSDRTRQIDVGTTHVSAKVSPGGKVTGQELPDLPVQGINRPLTKPVKLELTKGKLKGATLRTKVPDVLPEGITPEAVGYMTKHELSGHWFWVGGDYDPVSRTVTIQTPHFSEWVLGATSPDELIAATEDRQYKSFVGKEFAGLLTGNVPSLSCTFNGAKPYKAADVKPLVDVKIADDLPPEVKSCMGFNAKTGMYEIELVNPHSFPIRFKLPKGVTRDAKVYGDEQPLQLAWQMIAEKLYGGATILAQEGKLRLIVDPKELTDETVITGHLDYATFMVDTTVWLAEIITGGHQMQRLTGQRDPADKGGATEQYADFILKINGVAKCAAGLGEQLVTKVKNDPNANFRKIIINTLGKALTGCTSQLRDFVAKEGSLLFNLSEDLFKKGFIGRITNAWSILKSSMAQARREIDVLLITFLGGGKTYTVLVQPTKTVHIERALPAVGEPMFGEMEGGSYDGQGNRLADPRHLSSDVAFLLGDGLLQPDCTHGLELSPAWVEGGKVAVSAYTVTGDSGQVMAWFMLIPIKPDSWRKADTYLYGTKDKCYWEGGVQMGSFRKRESDKLGHTSVAYDIDSPTDNFTRKIAFSGGYMLMGTAGSVSPENVVPDAMRARILDKAYKRTAERIDSSFLGTRFLAAE